MMDKKQLVKRENPKMIAEEYLRVENISVTIDERCILEPSSFTIHAGEFVGIVGPNGAGKSTLLKALAHMMERSSGKVYIEGQDSDHLHAKERAKLLAYMPQNTDISFAYSVKEIVLTSRYPYLKWWEQEGDVDEEIVNRALEYMSVKHLQDKYVNEISGGERQRVYIAKALAQGTNLLMLDEPTSALDMGFANEIFEYCHDLCEQGKSIVVVVHDLELASKFCSRLLLIHDGRIVSDGVPKDVLTAVHLKEAFSMDADVYDDPRYEQLSIYVKKKEKVAMDL